MTSRMERVGLIAVIEGASKFIAETRKIAEEQAKIEASAKRTAEAHTQAHQRMATASKKSSQEAVLHAALIADAEKKVIAQEKVVEQARLKSIQATNEAIAAEQRLLAMRRQPRDPETGRFLPREASREDIVRASEAEAAARQKATQATRELRQELSDLHGQTSNIQAFKEMTTETGAEMARLQGVTAGTAAETEEAGKAADAASQRFDRLKNSVLNVAKAAAVAFLAYKSLGIIKGIIQDTTDLGVATFRLQKLIGGSTEEVSSLIFAFRTFGVEPQKLTTALGIFSRMVTLVEQNVHGLNTRGQQSTRVLAALGIQVLDSNKKLRPTIEILKDVADVFKNATDAQRETLRAGVGEQLFGQNIVELLPLLAQGRDGIEALQAEAERLGIVLGKEATEGAFAFFQAQKKLIESLRGLKFAIGNELIPVLTRVAEALTAFIRDNREGIAQMVRQVLASIEFFAGAAGRFVKTLNDLLFFLPKNEAAIVASITAIGVALTLAFGPKAAWIAGITLLASFAQTGITIGGVKAFGEQDPLSGQRGVFGRENVEGNIRQILEGLDLPNKILGAITPSFLQSEEWKEAERIAKDLQRLGITTIEQFDAYIEANEEFRTSLRGAAKDAKDAADDVDDLDLKGITDEMQRAIAEMRSLAEGFRSTSEAAGQVKSLTEGLNLFGEVSKELADKLELTAKAAGNVQGYDAVERALQRADKEAFNFTKALATVAEAFRRSADVANEIVLGLARSALQASQQAAQAVFGRPTREVADLNVRLAQRQLETAQAARGTNPQIAELQDQISRIDKQITTANKLAKEADERQKRAQQLAKDANRTAKRAADAAIEAAKEQLDLMKLNNLIQQVAYERMNANLERLIDATRRTASELQEKFLESNEKLQRQISEAIGRGDAETALTLVRQQRDQAKAYQEQAKQLTKTEQELISQQKALRLENEERQRAARLEEAMAEFLLRRMQAEEKLREQAERQSSALERQTSSIDRTTAALEAQKEALQKQLTTLNDGNEALRQQEQRIQEQIAVYQAQTNVMQQMAVAADKTLLTQEEQLEVAAELIRQIEIESQIVAELAKKTGQHLIPEIDAARTQFELLQDAIRVLADEGFRETLIEAGIDPATERLKIFDIAVETVSQAIRRLTFEKTIASEAEKKAASAAQQLANSARPLDEVVRKMTAGLIQLNLVDRLREIYNALVQGTNAFTKSLSLLGVKVKPQAEGGIYSSPTLALIGETRQKEAIIPLERPARARQIMAQIPPSVLASILPQGGQGAVFAPNITVTGHTLDTMEATAIRAVQRAFRDARVSSQRAGGLITQGVGPAR
jgi:hypothetical protein